jgi:hypothetical protein
MGFYNVINPSSMQAGQPEDVSQVLSNFNAIATVLNGGIDNSNIGAAAALAVSKLAAGAAGQHLGMLAGVPTWLGGLSQIDDKLLGVDTANFDFNPIPATYTHLLMVASLEATTAASGEQVWLRANNDSGTNYDTSRIFSGTITDQTLAQTKYYVFDAPGSTASPYSGGVVIFAPNYKDTTFRKTFFAIASQPNAPRIWISTSSWDSLLAINRLTLLPQANNWKTGSRATLYGLG